MAQVVMGQPRADLGSVMHREWKPSAVCDRLKLISMSDDADATFLPDGGVLLFDHAERCAIIVSCDGLEVDEIKDGRQRRLGDPNA